MIRFLDENYNILISAATTCRNLNYKPNFLSIVPLEKEYRQGIVRISFSPFNTREEINILLDALKEGLEYFI